MQPQHHQQWSAFPPNSNTNHMQQSSSVPQTYAQNQQHSHHNPPNEYARSAQMPPPPPPPPPPGSGPLLPPGWVTATDPISGRIYYANASSGETSWTPPTAVVPPPPPPPVAPYYPAPPPPQLRTAGAGAVRSPFPVSKGKETTNGGIVAAVVPPLAAGPTAVVRSAPVADPAVSGGMLVPTVRAMIEQERWATSSRKDGTVAPLELESLSAGTIADLCNVTREHKMEQKKALRSLSSASRRDDDDDNDDEDDEDPFSNYREPLKLNELPVAARPPHIEPGRVDIRLMALHQTLAKLSST